METTIVCWDYIGITENKMETTIRCIYIEVILGQWKIKWKLLQYIEAILEYWKIKRKLL